MARSPAEHDIPRDKAGYEIYLALHQPGCSICRLTNQALEQAASRMSNTTGGNREPG